MTVRITWTDERRAELRAYWSAGIKKTKIARLMGASRGSIDGQAIRENLHANGTRRVTLKTDHRAMRNGTTLFPTRVFDPVGIQPILKPGSYSSKLGGEVAKGHWRGMPIFTLALEERATCPTACLLYASCYGNHMRAAKRYRHGPELVARLADELTELQGRFPDGFVLRLHVLGDFYSPDYVEQWRAWLSQFPALHAFGYTAWQYDTDIGRAVAHLRNDMWERFAIRTSGAAQGPRSSVIQTAADVPVGTIICPAQTDKTTSCATCGLCWASLKPVAFLKH